jgi:hypothetical protein
MADVVYKDKFIWDAEKKVRLIHENLLKRLPPDLLREMARRQLAEIKKAGYDVPESIPPEKGA